MRAVTSGIRRLRTLGPEELMHEAKALGAPYELVRHVAGEGRLPVPNFAAGGIATPADAALMMALGAEAVFVGSGIFKSEDPAARARAIVRATTHYDDPARWPTPRGARRADARPRRGCHLPRRAPAGPRLVRRPPSASSPCRADFAAHVRVAARASGAAVREVRRVADLDGLARASCCRAASARRCFA